VPVLLDPAAPRIPFCRLDGVRDAPLPAPSAGALALGGDEARQLLLVPMTAHRAATGYVLYDADPESFLLCTRLTLALGAALHSAVLMERLELAYEKIEEQALQDVLTGLWNRRYLGDRLPEEVARHDRSRAGLSVCVVDLDGFKQVNDRHGHDAGDRVLCAVAAVLSKSLRACDVLARLGGDEFVALLPGAGPEQAMTLAARVVRALDRQDEHRLVSASVGVASAGDRPAGDDLGRALLRVADQALLEAKRRGKSRALHYSAMAAEPTEG
jgi:diguanylate cyclase (GGDEF)-like protein